MSRTLDILNTEYFEWLCRWVYQSDYPQTISYERLLTQLHDIEFKYVISNDRNRAEDGIALRYRFAIYRGNGDPERYVVEALDGPCSVLEMLIALAIRCEETIMDDTLIGNRTEQWFWTMLSNLGLASAYESVYDEKYVECVINRFLNREYDSDGTGGLFKIRNCPDDLRGIGIWRQLCWYLDEITDNRV